MKKVILTALLSLFICVVFAQKQQVVVPDTAQVTLTRVYNDVTQGIQGLAQALKAPTEKVWEILIKQQKVESIILVIVNSIILLITFIFVIWCIIVYKKDEWYSNDKAGLLIYTIIISVMSIFFLFASINTIVTGFVNPEYGAIKEILNVIS